MITMIETPWNPIAATAALPRELHQPHRWTQPRRIRVAPNHQDLFHPDIPDGVIAQVWEVMRCTPQHTYQVVTERPARMRAWLQQWADTTGDADARSEHGFPPMPRGPEAVRAVYTSGRAHLFAAMLEQMGTPPEGAAYPLYDWSEGPRWWPRVLANVWVGVRAQTQAQADARVGELLGAPAAVRYLIADPPRGPIDLGMGDPHAGHESDDVNGAPHPPICLTCSDPDGGREVEYWRRDFGEPHLDWVVAVAADERSPRPDWVRGLRDQCVAAGVPFTFSGWPGGRELDGRVWDGRPAVTW